MRVAASVTVNPPSSVVHAPPPPPPPSRSLGRYGCACMGGPSPGEGESNTLREALTGLGGGEGRARAGKGGRRGCVCGREGLPRLRAMDDSVSPARTVYGRRGAAPPPRSAPREGTISRPNSSSTLLCPDSGPPSLGRLGIASSRPPPQAPTPVCRNIEYVCIHRVCASSIYVEVLGAEWTPPPARRRELGDLGRTRADGPAFIRP